MLFAKKGGKTILTWIAGANDKKFVIYRFPKGKITDFSNAENIYYVTTATKFEAEGS
jgi:hypothetical protein